MVQKRDRHSGCFGQKRVYIENIFLRKCFLENDIFVPVFGVTVKCFQKNIINCFVDTKNQYYDKMTNIIF